MTALFAILNALSKSKLEDHVRKHTREKPFLCDQCNHRFSLKGNLKKHIQIVHQGIKQVQEKKYKCTLCEFATHSRSYLESHTQKHNPECSFACQQPNCEHEASSSRELELHIKSKHPEERKYSCQFPQCGFRGKTPMRLRQHYVTHSDSKPFVCDVPECNYGAKKKYSLKFHKLVAHNGGYGYRPFACEVPECNYRANTKRSLKLHKLGTHNGGYKPFACSTCSHRTFCKSRLKKHELTHSNEKPIKCSFNGCKFSCQTQTHLTEHVKNRHTERPFKCDFVGCLYTAASRSKLELHKKFVHYEKVYKCPQCDYRAAFSYKLKKHTRVHKAGPLIPCPIQGCTFKSNRPEYLKTHVSYHEANLDCPVERCSYVGTSKLVLKRHMKTHDPTGRPFHCLLCPQYFHSTNSLEVHLRSHTKEKPFKCPVCDYGAIRKQGITKHVRAIHSSLVTDFVCDDDEKFICNHCCVNFGSALGLALHTI